VLSDAPFRERHPVRDVDDQAGERVAQIGTSDQAIGDAELAAGGVLVVLERVVGAVQRDRDVAKYGVYPQLR